MLYRSVIALLLLLIFCTCEVPTPPLPFGAITSMPTAVKSARATAILDSLAEVGQVPYIKGDTVTYLLKNPAGPVTLAGDLNGWSGRNDDLARIKGTDIWYLSKVTPPAAYLEYKYVLPTGEWIADPLNPMQSGGLPGEEPNSLLVMPDFVQPSASRYDSTILHGRLDTLVNDSLSFPLLTQLIVYTPPNYDTSQARYPTLYLHDGAAQIDKAGVPNVLDKLIANGAIEPIIAVFTEPNDRSKQYAGSNKEAFASFFATSLVDYIDARYRTRSNAQSRAVTGPSFGGHISVLIAFTYPEVFHHCGANSVSWWPAKGQLMDYVQDRLDQDVNYLAAWGSYDGVRGNNVKMTPILAEAGFSKPPIVYPLGHCWKLWEMANIAFIKDFFPAN